MTTIDTTALRSTLVTALCFAAGCITEDAGPDLGAQEAALGAPFHDRAQLTLDTDDFACCGVFDEDSGACDGFRVAAHFDITRDLWVYLDAAGEPTRVALHARFTGTLSHGDVSVADRGSRQVVFDLASGETTLTGLALHVTLPGRGAVAMQTGRVVYDADGNLAFASASPHDLETGDLDLLCDALE